MITLKPAVTCHSGARDSYELSIALNKCNLLERLVTDLYLPSFLGSFLAKRYSSDLPPGKVHSLFRNFVSQKLLKNSYTNKDRRISLSAYKIARKTNSNLFLYSYTACEAFTLARNSLLDIRCFLFQLHPHPLEIRKILNDELSFVPTASSSIRKEPEMSDNPYVIERLSRESILADHCVVASSFTRKTLVINGIKPEKITVIPYGVDFARFPSKASYCKDSSRIRLVFVGQLIQRKGIYYLLEALKLIKSRNVELTLVGRGVMDLNLVNAYIPHINLTVKVNLSHMDLVKELHSHDMLVFPSLIEGFGHVILEAMSVGLPVLCTENTAGPDLFLSGCEGKIVPIRDPQAIADYIDYFISHKSELEEMGVIAASTARSFSWSNFRSSISQFYQNYSL